MKKGIVGKKIGMTQIFTEDGRLIPVTVIQAGPCPVVQKKTVENDGYEAIQVGFDAYAAVSYTHLDVYKRQYCYCIADEGCHLTYHRFTKEDYEAFGFETT